MALFNAAQAARINAFRESVVAHAQLLGKSIEQTAAEEIHALHTESRSLVIHAAAIGSIVGVLVGFVACWLLLK